MPKTLRRPSRKEVCCLVAFVCYWSWTFCALLTNVFAPNDPHGPLVDTWQASTVFHIATLVIIGLISRRHPLSQTKGGFQILAPSLTLAGFALILSAGGFDADALAFALAGSALAGAGTACMVMLWADLFSSCCDDQGKQTLLLLGVIGSALCEFALSLLPPVLLALALTILPLGSIAAVVFAGATEAPSPRERQDALSPRFLLFCLVFSVPLGLFQTWFRTDLNTLTGWGAILVPSAGVLVAVLALDRFVAKRTRTNIAEKLVMPVMVAGLFVLAAFDSGSILVAGVLVFSAQQIMSAVLYARFGVIASRGDISLPTVFATGIVVTDCGFLIGMLAGRLMGFGHANLALALVLGVAYLMIITAFLFYNGRAKGSEPNDPLSPNASEGSLDAIARSHSLTAREREMLEYLMRGKSVPAIASEVFLSANTVRTHIAHIYQKFDVHSRDELVSAVEKALAQNRISPDE